MESAQRLRTTIRGAVQGVGFRPFVYRLAQELCLRGWVKNTPQGLFIEVEGDKAELNSFLNRVRTEKPPHGFVQSMESTWLDSVGYPDFEIRESEAGGEKSAVIMPDLATCKDCLGEIFDPHNRRYLYPFTNCTNCGPRFTIVESLPYDRANTSMKGFRMCWQCQEEYDEPSNRRFHAQPNACPVCGPRLELWDEAGGVVPGSFDGDQRPGVARESPPPDGCARLGALEAAVEAIRNGRIIAVKGLGGFHLMVRADSDARVQILRDRKHREEKPFAVMFPSIEAVREVCEVSNLEDQMLRSPEAPIVLLRRRSGPGVGSVSAAVAPGNPNLGVLLPYTPLHHLLLARLQFPVIATSGNLSDEPICIDEREALSRLRGIADLFLVHNRPIVRHVDDSIVREIAGRELVLRRARGLAPMPVEVAGGEGGGVSSERETILGVGAHLKNSVALAVGPQVFISQHIGDLETEQAYGAFLRVGEDLQRLYGAAASRIASDLHPDYLSTRFADNTGLPCMKVQHHVAHVLSCMAENDLKPPVLGIAWDGTGFGADDTIWGGEFFRITETGYERVAHFRAFRLPGGEKAVREPRRCALGLLFEAFGEAAFAKDNLAPASSFSAVEFNSIKVMLTRKLNSPFTTSVGRLFDAVASLSGVRHRAHFEGQAAMELEFLVGSEPGRLSYGFELKQVGPALVIDWRPCLDGILRDLTEGIGPADISARFHNWLIESIDAVARKIGLERVVLSGGCFQNRYLTEQAIEKLSQNGFVPYWHQRVPPNDGGVCLGQVVAARWWKV